MHQVVNQLEVVQVVDLLLLYCCIEDSSPDFLIIPLDVVKLSSKVKEDSLVEADLLIPVLKDNSLFEVGIEQFSEMTSVQLSVVSEGLKKARNLLHAHIREVILKLTRPEVNPVLCTLIRLIVGPESAKRNPAAHMLSTGSRVVLLELFEH